MPFILDNAFTRYGHWICEACSRGEHELCVIWILDWDGRGCECLCTTGLET